MSNLVKNLKYDIPSGIIVFLVAVPLCLGIALASGAPLFSGIIAGIVGGIVVGIFSGSNLGVSGPAAGLAVIVLGAIEDLGGYEIFLLAVIIGGVIQLILGFLRAGFLSMFVPSSVIKGMLTAIGITIFLKQIPHAFGYDKDPEGDMSFNQIDGENTFSELINMLDYISYNALIITIISLGIFLLWEMYLMKKYKVFKIIQAPLVVVILGIALNSFFKGSSLEITESHLVNLPIANDLSTFVSFFTIPDFSKLLTNFDIYKVGLVIAIVASLETLLSVEAGDKLDPKKRTTPKSRELKAQGVGNILSGLIGGLPITQVIVRTSVNVQSGGKTKMSIIIHGLLILSSVLIFPNILNMIPLSSLAAILLVTGYKMSKPQLFKDMYRLGKYQFIPFIITIVGIIFTDLLVGILIGIAFGVFNVLKANYRTSVLDIVKNKDKDITIFLPESVSFLNKGAICRTLESIPSGYKVIVDGRRSKKIDYDIVETILEFKKKALNNNVIIGVLDVEARMPSKKHIKRINENIK